MLRHADAAEREAEQLVRDVGMAEHSVHTSREHQHALAGEVRAWAAELREEREQGARAGAEVGALRGALGALEEERCAAQAEQSAEGARAAARLGDLQGALRAAAAERARL